MDSRKFTEKDIKHDTPNIYYINLLHRKDRQELLLKDLKDIDYEDNRIHRVDAVKTKFGVIGCLSSHIQALKKGLNEQYNCDYIIILEDDFCIKNKDVSKKYLNKIFTEKDDWNVILLSMSGTFWRNEKLFLQKVNSSQTTSGYIIKKTYIPILLKLWEPLYYKTKDLNNAPPHGLCLDIYWKQLQHDKWFTTVPILGYQRESYSDIEGVVKNYGV